MREIVEPTVVEKSGGDFEETHPAFGVAVVTRGQGTGQTLFQSDVIHRHTVTLSIRRAVRIRSLHTDWVHPTQELVEIQMSEAQWGSLVSSVGMGSGTPVTIRTTETEHTVPDLPHQPRLAATLDEARSAVEKSLADARETLSRLEAAIDGKEGVRAVREALRRHAASLEHAPSNAEFAIKSVREAAEQVVSQAKSDIEIQMLQASRIVGLGTEIEAPILPAAIEGSS